MTDPTPHDGSAAPQTTPAAAPTRTPLTARWAIQFGLGILAGVALLWGVVQLSAGYARGFAPLPTETRFRLPPAPGNAPTVSVTLVPMADVTLSARDLVQGGDRAPQTFTFHAAIVRHPNGTLVLGAGPTPPPPWPVRNPFGAVTPRPGACESLVAAAPTRVLLPTLRWYNVGCVPALRAANIPLTLSATERWGATSGPWPWRYGNHTAWVEEHVRGHRSISWQNGSFPGRNRVWDVFSDRSVVAVAMRGASLDEIGLLVNTPEGRVLLTSDSIWHRDQVERLAPRRPTMTWFHDRNRHHLAALQQHMHHWERAGRVRVMPLLQPGE